MDTEKPFIRAIGANLWALRDILIDAVRDVDNGLEAIGQGQQDAAIGSIMPTEPSLNQAGILIQATLILHRHS